MEFFLVYHLIFCFNNISIESDKLKLILSENREYIGKSKYVGVDKVIAGVAFWIPIILTDFSKWSTIGLVIQIILVITGIVYMLYGIWEIYYTWKHPFNKEILYAQIEEANLMAEHPHSIVLIKDTFNVNSNRYLVYYDARWKCRLFLNYSTIISDFKADEDNIQKHLGMELKISENDIKGAFEFEKVHEKFSVSAQQRKCYRHRFYKYAINIFPETLKQDSFEIDGKKFYWMSIAEMENDKRIMEVNDDVVSMVKARG